MALPFKPITEVLTADDVQSYQHEQKIANKLLDAGLQVTQQHVNETSNTYYNGNHDSGQIPIAMGIYSLVGDPLNEDPIRPQLQRNIASHSWLPPFLSKASSPARTHYQLDLELVPNLIIVGGMATVRFAGTPTSTPISNVPAVEPYVWKSDNSHIHIYFGSVDIIAIFQVGIIVHGYVDPFAKSVHR